MQGGTRLGWDMGMHGAGHEQDSRGLSRGGERLRSSRVPGSLERCSQDAPWMLELGQKEEL